VNHEPSANYHLAGGRARAGHKPTTRFLEFFTANIRNPNTRLSYMRAVLQFLTWCEERGVSLHQIEPMLVAAYIEQRAGAPQTVKQHLAAIRVLFDCWWSGRSYHSIRWLRCGGRAIQEGEDAGALRSGGAPAAR
jgi:hypothetical protein